MGALAARIETGLKRVKEIFGSICTFDNLLLAARKARRGKRFLPAPALFHHNLEKELVRLQEDLESGSYRPGPYRTFRINDPKPRIISAAPFRDRVVHHAVCNLVEPIFERTFIFDSYACRKGKGTHAAADRLTRFMQSADYALQCDIRRYFPSIDHAILKTVLRRKIGCPRTLKLLEMFVDHSSVQEETGDYFPGDDLFTPHERARGLPIGNQTSQFFANVYLNPLDHFIKEDLGVRRYVRYVDDFVLLADDKETLHAQRQAIGDFLQNTLRLKLHPKKQTVFPVDVGADFCGYRVFPDHRRLRRDNGVRFARRLKLMQRQYSEGVADLQKVKQRIMSWIGHAAHADTWGLRASLFQGVAFSRAQAQARGAWGLVEQQ